MKKFLVISAAVSLMSTAAFATPVGSSHTSTSAAVIKSKIVTIQKPFAVQKQVQVGKAFATKGSDALVAQDQQGLNASVAFSNNGAIAAH